jgi:hypothetical protein
MEQNGGPRNALNGLFVSSVGKEIPKQVMLEQLDVRQSKSL